MSDFMFIGYYNKSVILTYLGVCFSIFGMNLAFSGEILYAFLCLLAAGICDIFDGPIARKCKRNRKEKMFGIEIDSLSDIINFVIFPIVIFHCMGYEEWYHNVIYTLFALGGVIRLGFFNVEAQSFHLHGPVKYYSGLPVTTTSFIFPIFYILSFILEPDIFEGLMTSLILLVSILFTYNFKIKKLTGKFLYFSALLAVVVAVTLLLLYF